ncbi:hypothetical protein BDV93DRAFT_566305 [Ceratobasidium sp. AG-I]|nr:hypothetical protein BDV93DRAFT_566305 [Ceratobasidium sp. AG-I]
MIQESEAGPSLTAPKTRRSQRVAGTKVKPKKKHKAKASEGAGENVEESGAEEAERQKRSRKSGTVNEHKFAFVESKVNAPQKEVAEAMEEREGVSTTRIPSSTAGRDQGAMVIVDEAESTRFSNSASCMRKAGARGSRWKADETEMSYCVKGMEAGGTVAIAKTRWSTSTLVTTLRKKEKGVAVVKQALLRLEKYEREGKDD